MKIIQSKTEKWDEGLPLGNGKIGSLVYGISQLKVTVDRTDLWDLRPNETTLESGFNYKNFQRLVKSGNEDDWTEYRRLFDEIFSATPYPSKITAGRIELNFQPEAKELRYELDVENAIASIFDGEQLIAEIFTDYDTFAGAIKLYRNCEYSFHIPIYLSGEAYNNSGIGNPKESISLGYPRAKIKEDGGYKWYEQNTLTDYSFGIVTLKVGNELYYTLATTDDDKDYVAYGKKVLCDASKIGFNELYLKHKKSWDDYWLLSSVCTGDDLIDSTYKKSLYLFRCCSRKGFYPMPLQGVWTADNDALPPWKGDYHHDTNTELSYQAYLKANRLNEGVSFVDYLWKLKPVYEKFAKEFFGVDGLLLPSCSTLDGKAMGGWGQYSLSPTMTIWAAQSFDEYYLYTADENFLKNKAYPFMKEVGIAIKGLLIEKDGKLYLPLSSSPEMFDNTRKAYLEPNSNFDLALMRYLYKTLIGYAQKLGETESEKEFKTIFEKLDDIAISDFKQVMLDKTQLLPETHRHFSHLMCMYPLHLLNFDTEENKLIYERTIAHIERLGSGLWVGFSFAMAAQIYAMAKRGNSAYEKIYQFCKGFVGENGFHLNGDFKYYGYTLLHYRPFTLESSFGFCDALHEMLLQDHLGYIDLFPAIPDEWKNNEVSFEKLRSRGGLLVSATIKNGSLTRLIISCKKDCVVNVNGKEYSLISGENKII